jgi:hypothetical protein
MAMIPVGLEAEGAEGAVFHPLGKEDTIARLLKAWQRKTGC